MIRFGQWRTAGARTVESLWAAPRRPWVKTLKTVLWWPTTTFSVWGAKHEMGTMMETQTSFKISLSNVVGESDSSETSVTRAGPRRTSGSSTRVMTPSSGSGRRVTAKVSTTSRTCATSWTSWPPPGWRIRDADLAAINNPLHLIYTWWEVFRLFILSTFLFSHFPYNPGVIWDKKALREGFILK